jgi:lipoprotein-anchoring transpeptidase ErfK/SrfK
MVGKRQNPSFSSTLMLVCMGAGGLMIAVQWRQLTSISFQFPKLQVSNLQGWTAKSSPSPKVRSTAKLVVDLGDRQVALYQDEKLQVKYPIAIGKQGWETPTGRFKVLHMYQDPVWQHPITGEKIPPGNRNPLGKRWIGFTTQGKLLIGFHGTTDYSLLGQAVSHGCLRMRNADITALYRRVEIGTPVIVQP